MAGKVTQLYNRAGLWQTRSQQAAAKGEFNRAGRLQTKALSLVAQARALEDKQRSK